MRDVGRAQVGGVRGNGPSNDVAPGRRSLSEAFTGPIMRKASEADGALPGADTAIPSGSGGVALPDGLRTSFGQSLDADLSGVRVHDGAGSAAAADALGARAFTAGQDIHFGAGEYAPDSSAGRELIAHEVVHTVQGARGGGAASAPALKAQVSAPGDAAEREADRVASALVSGGGPVEVHETPSAALHLKDKKPYGTKDELAAIKLSLRAITHEADVASDEMAAFEGDRDDRQAHIDRVAQAALPRLRLHLDHWLSLHERVDPTEYHAESQQHYRAMGRFMAFAPEGMPPDIADYGYDGATTDAPRHRSKFGTKDASKLINLSIDKARFDIDTGLARLKADVAANKDPMFDLDVDFITEPAGGQLDFVQTMLIGDDFDTPKARKGFKKAVEALTTSINRLGRYAKGQGGEDAMERTLLKLNSVRELCDLAPASRVRAGLSSNEELKGREAEKASDKAARESFIAKCSEANTLLDNGYKQAKIFLISIGQAYEVAWNNHVDTLKAAAKKDHLLDDLIWAGLTAFLPGGIGGVMGSVLRSAKAGDFMVDALKDLSKWGMRQGMDKVAVVEPPALQAYPTTPSGFMAAAETQVNEESLYSGKILKNWQHRANANDETFVLDFDPVTAITKTLVIKGTPLAQLKAVNKDQTAIDFEKGFWAEWLSNFGYTVKLGDGDDCDDLGCDTVAKVANNVNGTIKKRLQVVGLSPGMYTDAAKTKAEAKAKQLNKDWHNSQMYPTDLERE